MARWLCECERTNAERSTSCWSCGLPKTTETVDSLRTALAAANERAERAERQIAEMQAFARDWRDGTTTLIDEADANAKSSESDLTAARALLREVMPFVGGIPYTDEAMGKLSAVRARIEAHLEGR